MSDSFLTRAEIEALLGQAANRTHDVAPPTNMNTKAGDSIGSFVADEKIPQLSPSERKRRNRLWGIHEQAARDVGKALSTMLKAAVDMRLTSIESVNCQLFTSRMSAPTWICLLRSPLLPGQLVLELPLEILLPMLDRMLGSSIDAVSIGIKRPLSEIEQRLCMKIGGCITNELSKAWDTTYALTLAIDRVETDARWLSIGPPDVEAIVAAFDVRLGKACGTCQFAIPPQAMDVLDRHLLTPPTVSHQFNGNGLERSVDQSELTVELAPSPITAEDVENLAVGDLIATEHRVDAPVNVNLDGEPKFLGRIGATAARKAVRIEKEFNS